jgi:hypothetical protein
MKLAVIALLLWSWAGGASGQGIPSAPEEEPAARASSSAIPAAPPPIEGSAPSADEQPLPAEPAGGTQKVTVERFREALAPYGRWVSTPEYGEVWVPTVSDPHWRPYTHGEWVYTQQGWTFVSADPWGWAPFHYGRWIYYPSLGWAWIPGTEWAPAWVTWRYGTDYIAWAPLGPADAPITYYEYPSLWIAIGAPYFYGPLMRTHFLPTARVRDVIGRTHFAGVPRPGFYRSPPASYVAHVVRRPIVRVQAQIVAPRWVSGGVYQPRARIDRAYGRGRIISAPPGWPRTTTPAPSPRSRPTYAPLPRPRR